MFKSKFMIVVFAVLATFGVYAQVPDELNLNTGETAMQISLQKSLEKI